MAILKVSHSKNTSPYLYSTVPKYHDENSLNNVISYCCNPDKAKSGLIGGFGINVQYAAEQMDELARAYRQTDGIRLRHTVLAFEPGDRVSLENVFLIAYQVAEYYGREYQILFAVHEDTPHRHIHFVMNTVSYLDGHKYPGTKEDYYQFRDYVQKILNPYGLTVRLV